MPPGSFGTPVIDRTGQRLLLTAAHVVGSLSWAHELARTDVLVAAAGGPPGAGDRTMGDVVVSHPPEPTKLVMLDAALVAPLAHVTLGGPVRAGTLSSVPRNVELTADEDNPVLVYKRGINSPAVTQGLLNPVAESLRVRSVQADGTVLTRTYARGFFVVGGDEPFARPGDSGSIVVDDDDCIVGLLVALRAPDPHNPRPEDPAFVVPIVDILSEMGLELPGPNRACTVV
jgi:hypothetical protein